MFIKWIRNWFRRRRFENERALFTFFDGEADRRIDPLKAFMSLRDDPDFNLEDDPELICRDLAQPETDYFIAAMERAFGIKRFDGATGLTVEEMADLFTDLILWMNETQKKTGRGSTPSEPTGLESSTGQEDREEVSNCSSPSATAQSVPSYDGVQPLPTPSEHPPSESCPSGTL